MLSRIVILSILILNFLLTSTAFSQGAASTPQAQGPAQTQGCNKIDAHCICQNPTKDFKIENRKWGKSNPVAGEEGDCRAQLDIDEALKKAPVLFCMSGEQTNRDPSKPQTACQVTWTCKQTCIMK